MMEQTYYLRILEAVHRRAREINGMVSAQEEHRPESRPAPRAGDRARVLGRHLLQAVASPFSKEA